MQQVLERARRFAATSATILLCGESGTGKELLARFIHGHSSRRGAAYVRFNCAALSDSLIESELFGHEAGAFTGASVRRLGRFETAAEGTVFLDEVGELPVPMQSKLLRVLEEREYQRVGSNEVLSFAGRVVAATNRDLRQEVRFRRFREDLYYRLNVLALPVPPLRERREDIPPLVNHFVQQCQSDLDRPVRGVTRPVMQKLCDYDWPGNIRELRNVILRSCILSAGETIESLDLPAALSEVEDDSEELSGSLRELTLEEIERRVILHRLEIFQGNKVEAAAALGVTPRTLRNKVAQYRRLGFAG